MHTTARFFSSLFAATSLLLASALGRAEPLPDALGEELATRSDASFPSHVANADPIARTLLGLGGQCRPGTRVACSCPGGGAGAQQCEPSGARFSLCACGSVTLNVPKPPILVVETPLPSFKPVRVQQRQRAPGKRSSGLGMLIGGSITLAIGTGNLIWGIDRVRKTDRDALGIVMISTGGVAMAVGLPLTIVGIVFLATRGLHPDEPAKTKTEAARDWKSGISFAPTADGFAIRF